MEGTVGRNAEHVINGDGECCKIQTRELLELCYKNLKLVYNFSGNATGGRSVLFSMRCYLGKLHFTQNPWLEHTEK